MSVMCKYCQKIFSSQSNLNRHIREVHNLKTNYVSYNKSTWNYKCLEFNCNSSFQKNKGLIWHLKEVHEKKFDEEQEFVFTNKNEFECWKCIIELEGKCNYVVSSTWASTKGDVTYYSCSRTKTGKIPSQTRQRQLKSQGSCKLNVACISQIKMINEDQKILVFWQKAHYGHSMELQHLRLPKNDKAQIATKLISGVPTTKILDSVRDKIQEQLKRIDFLTAKDVNNIKTSYRIEERDGRRHQDDAISIDLWVEECMRKPSDENPILIYKKQGTISNSLDANDFCLITMNKFQEEMLRKFGNNIIAVDGTHGLNNYDFELTTIMVVDEFGEGFPITFMFSNRKDTHIYTLLFQAIKQKVGDINANTFMSDLAEAFYKAWLLVMTPVTYHLFCAWHIDRAWQNNLNKINNKEKRSEIYKILKVLQEEIDETKFESNLSSALNVMLSDTDTERFGKYFQLNYINNYRQWAYCFRKSAGINTNMRLESLHKTIKYFYLNHKKVKRLDKGLHAVLKFLRDKSVERIIKLIKGKSTTYSRDSFKRHRSAVDSKFDIKVQSDTCWEIINKTESYLVKQLLPSSCCNLSCSLCKICYHMYSCKCYDYIRKSVICKHIHYIVLMHPEKSQDNLENQMEIADAENNFVTALIQTNSKVLDGNLEEHIKYTFQNLLSSNLNDLDDSVVLEINSHLKVLNNLIHLPPNEVQNNFKEIENNKEPPNKNINTQSRFFSTQKKRKCTNSKCKKPNKKEVSTIKNILDNTPVIYIYINKFK